jgi:hypothetical protein
MTVVTAPAECSREVSTSVVFLAGGITDAEDWQRALIRMVSDVELVVLNPRRESFPMGDESAGREQIAWEFRHLRMADAVAFWFPPQTLCPIALFELGVQTAGRRPLFVGVDPGYRRRFDVQVQLALARPEVKIVGRLEDLAGQVRAWATAATRRKEMAK